jgi:hypothetical protein
MRQNPGISLTRPLEASINRSRAFNKEEITTCYENMEGVMIKYQFIPVKIFNVDAVGINTVRKAVKIVGENGGIRVGTAVSLERG